MDKTVIQIGIHTKRNPRILLDLSALMNKCFYKNVGSLLRILCRWEGLYANFSPITSKAKTRGIKKEKTIGSSIKVSNAITGFNSEGIFSWRANVLNIWQIGSNFLWSFESRFWPQAQHHLWWQILQVIWEHPEIFSKVQAHLGHLWILESPDPSQSITFCSSHLLFPWPFSLHLTQ